MAKPRTPLANPNKLRHSVIHGNWVFTHICHICAIGLLLGENWKAQPAQATLANGVMAHAFELDNVRQPGAGVHPGATAFLPAFAMAEETKADGKALLAAFVAACEVMSRIGVAAGNSLERRGFHAPGLTGTFGAAVAAGRLLGLNEREMVNALGVAGSYSGGLIEFPLPGRGDDQAAPSR
jgi:2-methylcitrate dehydratase PrpD